MIGMNDFNAEPAELRAQEKAAVERVLDSGWFILGREGEAFEADWAKYCGAAFAVGVGNGMDAIEIGLRALHIGPGDEVITTPLTAIATVLAIVRSGATPVLADIDPATALLDLTAVESCLTARTKAVLLVHLYGQARNLDAWSRFCQENNLHLLEDCAQAHGAVWNGRKVGTFGPWGAYSFYPTKNLGAKGDGGALITNLPELAARARMLRNYGQSERYHHPVAGLNSRLDEMQAAILQVRLAWLDRFNVRRQEIATAYNAGLKHPQIQLLAPPLESASHVHHLFVIRSLERDRLAQHLQAQGITTHIHYPVPCHRQPAVQTLCHVPHPLPHAEQHAQTCLSLPCHPGLTDEQVEKVVSAVKGF